MGKAGRWLKSFLSGKKDKRPPQDEATPVLALPPPTPKEKRWSFRRPVPAGKSAAETPATEGRGGVSADVELEQKKHGVATAAVARLSCRRASLPASLDAAAVRIQATFRGYLARTALRALRGIVKLQALMRGQLVRRQANATLRRMQALLAAQAQLRAQRMRVLQEEHHQQQPPRRSPQHPRHRRPYETDRSSEDNAKIVEVDIGGAAKDRECFVEYQHGRCSPAVTETSPRAYSGRFDELSLATSRSSPRHEAASELCCPSYMANTESSRTKARSQSAPRQRADALERQQSRRKGTPPRSSSAAKMQRSSSLVGAPAPRSPAPWWSAAAGRVRLDASLKDDSESGSTSSVLTAATVYSRTRSLVGFEVRRGMY